MADPIALSAWRLDLGEELTDKIWLYCCSQTQHLSPNYKLRLIHFKFLNRFYRTPLQLHKIKLREDSNCWKCRREGAAFLHIAWECPGVQDYWCEVAQIISEVLNQTLECSPLVMLLGYVERLEVAGRKLAAMMLVLARRRLAIHWGAPRGPRSSDWLQDITYCQENLSLYWDLMPKDIWAHLGNGYVGKSPLMALLMMVLPVTLRRLVCRPIQTIDSHVECCICVELGPTSMIVCACNVGILSK